MTARRTAQGRTREFYDGISRAYDLIADSSEHAARDLGLRTLGVSSGERVLEIGCGTGALSFSIAGSFALSRVTAVDRSINYVKHARAAAPSSRVRFFVGDAQALALADEAFDKTLSLLVLNFVPDPAKALREMVRVTRGTVAAGEARP